MDLELTGKCFLVTGSSRGIGRAVAERFLSEGAGVVLTARTSAPLQRAVDALAKRFGAGCVDALPADCADSEALAELRDTIQRRFGRLDGVVANVGDGRSVPDPLPDNEQWARVWRSNFETAMETARVFLPLLKDTRGCLLFISSIVGIEAIGAPTDYSVAKAALMALAKQLARKMAPEVRVNCLAPGNVLFPGGNWEAKIEAEPDRIHALIEATVPMNRFGTPEEIADAAVFLCSDRSRFTTGACLVVDGGQTVGW